MTLHSYKVYKRWVHYSDWSYPLQMGIKAEHNHKKSFAVIIKLPR